MGKAAILTLLPDMNWDIPFYVFHNKVQFCLPGNVTIDKLKNCLYFLKYAIHATYKIIQYNSKFSFECTTTVMQKFVQCHSFL